MKLTEERKAIARAIWNIRREDEDRCDIELEDLGRDHSVWREADAAIAALPKPEPVAEVAPSADGSGIIGVKWSESANVRRLMFGDTLYPEAPITPPASEQKPVAWVTTNEDGDYAMLFFDQQEARSYSGDDEPIGLAPVSVSALLPEQENYKAQRDALLEELEKAAVAFWKLDNADIHAQEAESAIASVKGGE